MTKERLLYLLSVYQQQTETSEERAEFAQLIHDKKYSELIDQALDSQWEDLSTDEIRTVNMPNYDTLLTEIIREPQPPKRRNLWPLITIAASILLMVSAGLFFYGSSSKPQDFQISADQDIAPGKYAATLTLANGKKIAISSATAGEIAEESGFRILKAKDGTLIYEIIDDANAASGLNTLTTFRGEQTQVRLQDGTLVFLNAESSLQYPTSFTKTPKREVTLTGEAYFEVSKDKSHPFVVNTHQQHIEVLGTTFNASSYVNDVFGKTTLVEGSVKISDPDGKSSAILKPGEQAIVGSHSFLTKKVVAEDEIAWKNGYFMFNNETLESIMQKVARWYNIEVIYKDDAIKKRTFFGSVSRFEKVSEILKLLQKTGNVAFQIKGNQIIAEQLRSNQSF